MLDWFKLKKKEAVTEFFLDIFANVFAYEIGQLGRILTRSWHPNCTGPVVVHVRHFVRQLLKVVRLHSTVVHYDVVGWRYRPLINVLRNQIKIPPVAPSESVVHHSSRRRIGQRVGLKFAQNKNKNNIPFL